MPWRESLSLEGRGSFRGVEFLVDKAESEIGRRKIVHEFPGRNQPHVQDDGRLPRRFVLDCYVVGPEYHTGRDLLRAEFEAEGPGTLVHPYWGEFEVEVISPVQVRETVRDGGMARFSLTVIEVGGQELIVAEPDLGPEVEIKADAAGAAIAEDFADTFSVTGAIEAVITAATTAVNTLSTKLRKARGLVNTALNVVDTVGDSITTLGDTAASLVLAPVSLASSIQGVHASVLGAISGIEEAFSQTSALVGRLFGDFQAERLMESFRELTGDQGISEVIDPGSSQSLIEKTNRDALVAIQQQTAAVEAARNLVLIEFSNRDLLTEFRDEVATALDTLSRTASDEVWAAMADLRDVFHRRMTQLGQDLPDLVEFTPVETRPALTLAYDLHGDSTRAAEIISRNNVRDPNFVPGGKVLRVVAE